jgi:thiamine-phosphate pyrophosphorylase
MASVLRIRQLARAAFALNAKRARVPALVLMTDERRLQDPVPAAHALPKGAAIVLRHTGAKSLAALAHRLKPIARKRGILLLIAGDGALAARIGADGLHLPETRAREARFWKTRHPAWRITVAAHSLKALGVAVRVGADAAILAPVFATRSHAGRAPLGAARARLMARAVPLPVIALGGIDARNVSVLGPACFCGIAAIGALAPS